MRVSLCGIYPRYTFWARALRRVAARDDVPVSAVVKKLLEDALVAEGEIEITPTPRPRKRIARIDTGHSGPGVVPYLPLTDLPVPPSRTSTPPRVGTSSTGGAQ